MLECKVCGTKFKALAEKHYIAKDNARTGAIVVLSNDEEKIYDAYDCPICGSQIIAQERKRIFITTAYDPNNTCDNEQEEKNIV